MRLEKLYHVKKPFPRVLLSASQPPLSGFLANRNVTLNPALRKNGSAMMKGVVSQFFLKKWALFADDRNHFLVFICGQREP